MLDLRAGLGSDLTCIIDLPCLFRLIGWPCCRIRRHLTLPPHRCFSTVTSELMSSI
jgi:hypothetical protein